MIRIGLLSLFGAVSAEEVISFHDTHARRVKLTVNAPYQTVLNLIPLGDDGKPVEDGDYFLATWQGLEEIEFDVEGPFALHADQPYSLKTIEGMVISAVVHDAESFVRISERRPRNPDMEHMSYLMAQQLQRAMGPVYEQLEREREEFRRERASQANNTGTGPVGPDPAAPRPADGAGSSDGSAQAAPGGSPSGNGAAEGTGNG